jgi:hypothetical protein
MNTPCRKKFPAPSIMTPESCPVLGARCSVLAERSRQSLTATQQGPRRVGPRSVTFRPQKWRISSAAGTDPRDAKFQDDVVRPQLRRQAFQFAPGVQMHPEAKIAKSRFKIPLPFIHRFAAITR